MPKKSSKSARGLGRFAQTKLFKTKILPAAVIIAVFALVIFLFAPLPHVIQAEDEGNIQVTFVDAAGSPIADTESVFEAEATLYDRNGNPIGTIPTTNLALMTGTGLEVGYINFTLTYIVTGTDVDWDSMAVNYTEGVVVIRDFGTDNPSATTNKIGSIESTAQNGTINGLLPQNPSCAIDQVDPIGQILYENLLLGSVMIYNQGRLNKNSCIHQALPDSKSLAFDLQ